MTPPRPPSADDSFDVDDELPHKPPLDTMTWGSANCWVIGLDCRSMNLYRFLRVQLPTAPRGLLQSWLDEGKVTRNGQAAADSRPLRPGDVVTVEADVTRLPARRRPRSDVEVLYEDESMLVVYKPSGLATSPERAISKPSLLTKLKDEHGDHLKLVHRIDKPASGLVVFARGRDAKRALIADFVARRVTKDYLALVSGRFGDEPRVETARLAPVRSKRPRMEVRTSGGKDAVTLLRPAWPFRGYTLMHARPVTGRTHQIRAHLRHAGHAIVGDETYRGEAALYLSKLKPRFRKGRGEQERPLLDRLALHAFAIRLRSPALGSEVEVRAPLPKSIRSTLRQLQKVACVRESDQFDTWLDDPIAGAVFPEIPAAKGSSGDSLPGGESEDGDLDDVLADGSPEGAA